jgi:hypothetical protein
MFNLNWVQDVHQCSGGRVSWKYRREMYDKIVFTNSAGKVVEVSAHASVLHFLNPFPRYFYQYTESGSEHCVSYHTRIHTQSHYIPFSVPSRLYDIFFLYYQFVANTHAVNMV